MNNFATWLKSLSIGNKVLIGAVLSILSIGIVGATQNQNPQAPPTQVVSTQTVDETQSIPFTSSSVDNPSLNKGTSKVTTAGVDGSKTLTYEITYTNGVQTDKKLVNTVVNTPPINQVTSIGTYIYVPPPAPTCPNGTYVNSAGNTVCSPYSSPSAPSGASAQCVDGTYSFSQSRSGTCSHHGGVSLWL